MTDETPRTTAPRSASLRSARARARARAKSLFLRRGGPFARRHLREAQTIAALGRLEGEFEHLRKRHSEQIERLEDLTRELILTAEALRSAAGHGAAPPARRPSGGKAA